MKLYKYRKCDEYIYDNILYSNFVYSRVSNFNDPFEITPNYKLVLDDYHEEYFAKKSEDYESFFNDLNNQKVMTETLKRLFVASFTKNNDDILMWSHYGDSHRGLCFEFDIPEDKLSEFILRDVRYFDKRATIEIKFEKNYDPEKKNTNRVNILAEDIKPLFFVKSKLWEHEQEIRMIYKDKELEYDKMLYAPLFLPYLTHIYLGAKIPEQNQLLIETLAKKVNVPVSKMVADKQEFKLNSYMIPPIDS
jgi:hypothetical protein